MEKLIAFIENLKSNRNVTNFDEAATKQGIILPILQMLGWNIFDIDEVMPEFSTGDGRVDYSLKLDGYNKVFIEAKKTSEDLENHEEQLLSYSFREGVEIAALTNGITWSFYLPTKKGDWKERKFFTIDLVQQEPRDAASKFVELLLKTNVLSGTALENADRIYRDRQRKAKVEQALPDVWVKLISEPDPLLIDLLSEATEKQSGFKPDIETVKNFLQSCQDNSLPEVSVIQQVEKRAPIHKKLSSKGKKAGRVSLQELVDAGLLRDGQTLFFYHTGQAFKDEKVTVLASMSKVKYERDGKIYSLSELAKNLLQKHCGKRDEHQVAGPKYWQTYDGRLLNDLNEQIRSRRGDRK
ncbi:MAG: hypothetical protein JW749_08415 [Sedimentisphaerales bacterium]|nr:hypothetical protein [Sedimentisphaerales bacterium]